MFVFCVRIVQKGVRRSQTWTQIETKSLERTLTTSRIIADLKKQSHRIWKRIGCQILQLRCVEQLRQTKSDKSSYVVAIFIIIVNCLYLQEQKKCFRSLCQPIRTNSAMDDRVMLYLFANEFSHSGSHSFRDILNRFLVPAEASEHSE